MSGPLINAESPQEVIDAYVAGYSIGYKNGVLDGRSDSASFVASSMEPLATVGEVTLNDLGSAYKFRSEHKRRIMAKFAEKQAATE